AVGRLTAHRRWRTSYPRRHVGPSHYATSLPSAGAPVTSSCPPITCNGSLLSRNAEPSKRRIALDSRLSLLRKPSFRGSERRLCERHLRSLTPNSFCGST